MKRLFIVLVMVVLMTIPVSVYASLAGKNYGGELRVGLTSKYADLASVTFKNGSFIAGYVGSGGFKIVFTVDNKPNIVAAADSSYYVAKKGSATTYEAAYAEALAYDGNLYRAAPCAQDIDQWTVYIGGYPTLKQAQDVAVLVGGTVVNPNSRRIVLMENNKNIIVFDSPNLFPQFAAVDGVWLSLGDRNYRGRIELLRQEGKNLTAVNVIGVEQYLYSVLPSEMPPTWHFEALKAQAVASRTYTAHRRNIHGTSGFDVCDAAHCQVYNGAGAETLAATAAVDATADIMIWYANEPISAVYFASSGGRTDNAENVWTNHEFYLRGVQEVNEQTAKKWSRLVSLADLDRALAASGIYIGSATGMYTGRMDNNRVQELVITGTAGSRTLVKEEIRAFFQPLTGGTLESRNFTISQGGITNDVLAGPVWATDGYVTVTQELNTFYALWENGEVKPVSSTGEVITVAAAYDTAAYSSLGNVFAPAGSYAINGMGSGHGVGMSQAGAKGMAEIGYSFDQILKHYYTGVEIRRYQ